MHADNELTLAEALGSLREQLMDAVDQAQGEDLALVCQGIEVELQVTVATTVKGEIRGGFWNVVTAGGGVDRSNAAVHTVKLSLVPERGGSAEKLRLADPD
ncbi:trypco2 family protein [Phytohabitans aurantiacus]|uniref:Trypsin-co-occurring domain-containing protein n=1 Tax=Phytohabitans aurantiacus TaxID=3016789 RepID=A0ABQ5QMI6_9ACTN|nr:trypco2 family protein [Phytohabitans aurantiacus]GLH95449.1 hypothetical protein Pa4123_07210 [Phytohabitans aurantiacus]